MRDIAQVDMAGGHEIEQTARRGDDDVGAAAERSDLRLLADTAEDDGAAEREVAGEHRDCFFDLRGELTGWGEDERARGAAAAVVRRAGELVEDRQGGCGGLCPGGLGGADEGPGGP